MITTESERDFGDELERFNVRFERILNDRTVNVKTFTGQWRHLKDDFPLMSELALATSALPHNTIQVERLFNNLKDFKSNKCNRLTAKKT